MSIEEIRQRYQAALARRVDPAPGVSLEQLEALVAHRLPEAEALALLDRVMADDGLRREYEMLRSVHVASIASRPMQWWRPVLAVAASLALVVTIGALMRAGGGPAGTVRGDPRAELLALPAPGAVAALPATLVWHAVPGARSYRVEVLDPDGAVLHARETRDTFAVVGTADVPAGVAQWWVEVRFTAGAERSVLRPVRFTGP